MGRRAVTPLGLPTGPDPVAAMRNVIERIQRSATSVIAEADKDRELREALTTEATATGARIGQWDIHHRVDDGRNFYDIAASGADGRLVVAELTLYEAARGLVRLLNEGGTINTRAAMDILRAESDYTGAVNDAIHFRHNIRQQPEEFRRHLLETRYGEARLRAMTARARVQKLVG